MHECFVCVYTSLNLHITVLHKAGPRRSSKHRFRILYGKSSWFELCCGHGLWIANRDILLLLRIGYNMNEYVCSLSWVDIFLRSDKGRDITVLHKESGGQMIAQNNYFSHTFFFFFFFWILYRWEKKLFWATSWWTCFEEKGDTKGEKNDSTCVCVCVCVCVWIL